MYRNDLIFVDTLPRDNRDSLNFQVGQSKLPYFLQNFRFVIMRAGHILKSHQQNCFIFEKSLPRGNRVSVNCQVISSKLPYFCKHFIS